MTKKTLDKMRFGGIFDQLGYGFHRYSTDSKWIVPHFEKMLYDQAMMAIVYIEAYQATGKKEYRETAEKIFQYVLRDMNSSNGGFFSAEDADSEGEEGKFYLWTKGEIRKVLGIDADLFIKVFNISIDGNYYDEVNKTRTGKNILFLTKSLHKLSINTDIGYENFIKTLRDLRQRLYEHRETRIHPLKDDKILTNWNGLMIASLAKGARVFSSLRLRKAAEKAANFILGKLHRVDGMLFHMYRECEALITGNLDDYVFLIWGLIELYETTFKIKYLIEALNLQDYVIEHFWDKRDGGFFFKSDYSEKLLIRHKEFYDGALPSGNSVAFLNLIKLSRMTGKIIYEKKAAKLARVFSSHKEGYPSHNTMFLSALDFFIGPSYEIVIVGKKDSNETKAILEALSKNFVPNKVILLKNGNFKNLENINFIEEMKTIDNKTTVYVCKNFVCNKPLTKKEDLLKLIN
jgi:uncharacterized protein YyaL (SSP411 family)